MPFYNRNRDWLRGFTSEVCLTALCLGALRSTVRLKSPNGQDVTKLAKIGVKGLPYIKKNEIKDVAVTCINPLAHNDAKSHNSCSTAVC